MRPLPPVIALLALVACGKDLSLEGKYAFDPKWTGMLVHPLSPDGGPLTVLEVLISADDLSSYCGKLKDTRPSSGRFVDVAMIGNPPVPGGYTANTSAVIVVDEWLAGNKIHEVARSVSGGVSLSEYDDQHAKGNFEVHMIDRGTSEQSDLKGTFDAKVCDRW